MAERCFFTDDLWALEAGLAEKGYHREREGDWIVHEKTLSGALTKRYSRPARLSNDTAVSISVSSSLVGGGEPLRRLAAELKRLNRRYRLALPGWKTLPPAGEGERQRRRRALRTFFRTHAELTSCFVSEPLEGTFTYRLDAAASPRELSVCLQFVMAVEDAVRPRGIVRGRRGADAPLRQRDGWIKRFAEDQRRRGKPPFNIVRDIQKRLREGTWNERDGDQYNISNSTVGKIAGVKIPRPTSPLVGHVPSPGDL